MIADMTNISAASVLEVDRLFFENMTPHHAAGIPTARRARRNLKSLKARELSQEIFDNQPKEVGEMQMLLKSLPSSNSDGAVGDAF